MARKILLLLCVAFLVVAPAFGGCGLREKRTPDSGSSNIPGNDDGTTGESKPIDRRLLLEELEQEIAELLELLGQLDHLEEEDLDF